MKLSEASFAVIDLETTGLDPTARIIEVAVVHLDPGQLPRVAYTSRVNPQIEIPEKVTRITGISDADVASAPTWAEVAPLVLAAIGDRVCGAYNVPADFRWLSAECDRDGYDAPAFPWVDAYVLARSEHCDKFARGGKRLADVARRRGIVVDAHGAAGDAVTTALLLPLLAREAGVWGTDVDDYLDDQTSMALHQERDFAAFLVLQAGNGRGRPVELSEGAWRTAGFAHLTESAREKGFTERLQLPIIGDRVDLIGRGDWPTEVACAVAGAEQVAPLALDAADGLVALFDPPYHVDGERERSRTGYGWDLAHERVLQLAARTADARAKVLITEGGPLAKRLGPGWHSANITAHFTGRVVGEEWITTNFPIELGSTRGRQHSLFG